MKQEIIDWYTERSYEPHKLISLFNARHGYSQSRVESAMIHCYDKIVHERKKITDNDVARYVKNVAKDVEVIERMKELKVLYESKDRLDRYKHTVLGVCVIQILLHGLMILYYITLV